MNPKEEKGRMKTLSNELDAIFRSSIPESLELEALRILWMIYKDTPLLIEQIFLPPEARDIAPFMRRAIFEQSLRSKANRIPGITATSEPTKGRGNSYTRIVGIDGRVILTSSYLRAKHEFPRKSEFREAYSQSPQLHLYKDNSINPNGPFYGILAHGPNPKNRNELGFAFIGVPDSEYAEFIHKIDLFKKHISLIEEFRNGVEISSPVPRIHILPYEKAE